MTILGSMRAQHISQCAHVQPHKQFPLEYQLKKETKFYLFIKPLFSILSLIWVVSVPHISTAWAQRRSAARSHKGYQRREAPCGFARYELNKQNLFRAPGGNVSALSFWGGGDGTWWILSILAVSVGTLEKVKLRRKSSNFAWISKRGVINNALWIPRWEVTEHRKQDSSVRLVLSGRKWGTFILSALDALNTSSLRKTRMYFHLARKTLKWKYPRCPLQSSSKNLHKLTQKRKPLVFPTFCNHLKCITTAFISRVIKLEFMARMSKKSYFSDYLKRRLSTNIPNIHRSFVFSMPRYTRPQIQSNTQVYI